MTLGQSNEQESTDSITYPVNITESLSSIKIQSMKSTNVRWIVLFFACWSCMGDYYCGNLTQALQSYLMKDFDVDNLKFNTITTAGNIPSIILPFVGGALIDRFGVRPVFSYFCFLVIIGQAILTYGVAILNFELVIVGKVVSAIGAGPLFVAKSAMLVKWFMGKELSFALGAALCVSRLGSSIDSIISPRVYEWTGELYVPFLIGVFVCVFAWITVLCINHFDRKLDEHDRAILPEAKSAEKFTVKDLLRSTKRIYFQLVLSVGLLYGVFFGFTGNLNDHLVTRFGFKPAQAGIIIPIIYVCPTFITPFFGAFVDKNGKRVRMILMASVVFLLSHIYIAFLNDTTAPDANYFIIVGLVGVGVFYSIYAAVIWPCIALIVDQRMTGLAYGFTNSFQCIVLSILPLILGEVNVSTKSYKHGYFWSQIILAGVVVLGMAVTAVIYREDINTGGKLNNPGTKREAEKEELLPKRDNSVHKL